MTKRRDKDYRPNSLAPTEPVTSRAVLESFQGPIPPPGVQEVKSVTIFLRRIPPVERGFQRHGRIE